MNGKSTFPPACFPKELTAEESAHRFAIAAVWAGMSKATSSPDGASQPADDRLSLATVLSMLAVSGLSLRKIRHSILVGLCSLRIGHALAQTGFLTTPNAPNATNSLKSSSSKNSLPKDSTPTTKSESQPLLNQPYDALAFDPHLFLCAGILHDLLRYEEEHAVKAGAFLSALGMIKTGYAVACHTRLPVDMLETLHITLRDGGYLTADLPQTLSASDTALARGAALCVFAADKYAFGDLIVPVPTRFRLIRNFFFNPPESLNVRERVALAVEGVINAACQKDTVDIVSSSCAEFQSHAKSHVGEITDKCTALEQELYAIMPPPFVPRLHDDEELAKELALPPQRYYKGSEKHEPDHE